MIDLVRDYRVWRTLPQGDVVQVGTMVLKTSTDGHYRDASFQYEHAYLEAGHAALNPITMPVASGEIHFGGRQPPAIVDELLPGRWGRSVLASHWQLHGLDRRVDDLHALLSEDGALSMGAIRITAGNHEAPPSADLGWPLETLSQIMKGVDQVSGAEQGTLDEVVRMKAGAHLGGARPKALATDGEERVLAKFNRADDPFSHVRVEYATLMLAREAGLSVPDVQVVSLADQEALLVRRFDVTPTGGRHHVISVNALLKDARTHEDRAHPSYEDLVELVRKFSSDPNADLRQLYGQMLFNAAIQNTDDHLRNFSFVDDGQGWRLSPAYDLVPDEAFGNYHQMGWGLRPNPPRPSEGASAARAFGLSAGEADAVIERMRCVLMRAEELFQACGVCDEDLNRLRPVFSWGRS